MPLQTQTWLIGDKDGFGVGVPANGDHPFDGVFANEDHRSAGEAAATNGAQFTDTYSTAQIGYSPHAVTTATFIFSGLGDGWTEGFVEFNLADLQSRTFGNMIGSFNGIPMDGTFGSPDFDFNIGFPHTEIVQFPLIQAVLDSINSLGTLTITIARNSSTDFYSVDYIELNMSRPMDLGLIGPIAWLRWPRRVP